MSVQPHSTNRCAIPADKTEWLEVYLTHKCNAICEWCFDRNSYSPSEDGGYKKLAETILSHTQPNIILTGGEPTLYKELKPLIQELKDKKNLYITTNGFKLRGDYIDTLIGIKGITISIHHFDLTKNFEITHIKLDEENLTEFIKRLHDNNIEVRINCTVTKGYLETKKDIYDFIEFGKRIGVNAIRFAEVSYYDEAFIDINKIFNGEHGLNDEPFTLGCYRTTEINGMSIDFKQSCGALTNQRKFPDGAKTETYKNIVYYDGESYKGWQSNYRFFEEKTVDTILDDFLNNKISKENAIKYLSS